MQTTLLRWRAGSRTQPTRCSLGQAIEEHYRHRLVRIPTTTASTIRVTRSASRMSASRTRIGASTPPKPLGVTYFGCRSDMHRSLKIIRRTPRHYQPFRHESTDSRLRCGSHTEWSDRGLWEGAFKAPIKHVDGGVYQLLRDVAEQVDEFPVEATSFRQN